MSQLGNNAPGQASSQQVDLIGPADEQSPDEDCWRLCNLLSLGRVFLWKPKQSTEKKMVGSLARNRSDSFFHCIVSKSMRGRGWSLLYFGRKFRDCVLGFDASMRHKTRWIPGRLSSIILVHLHETEKELTLFPDGGGIRGWWSLLVLNSLLEYIEVVEMELAGEEYNSPKGLHSFWPQEHPVHVSHVPLNDEETQRLRDAEQTDDQRARLRALRPSRRFLPCHYFDFIIGSSTGA